MTEAIAEKQDQTVESEDAIKAGEEQPQAGDTATPEGEHGLQKKEEGISVEEIVSGEKPETDGEISTEKGVTPEGQERINRKIGNAIKERKIAQEETRKLREENVQLKIVQAAPKEKPMVPIESSFDNTEAYQAAYDKYQTDLNTYNEAQASITAQTEEANARSQANDERLATQTKELQVMFPDIDVAQVINATNYGYARQDIADSEHNVRIGLYLAKNEAERIRIGSISHAGKRAKEITRLEVRLDTAQEKKPTNASPALNTLKGDTETVVEDINKIKNDDDWYKARQAERRRILQEKQKKT